MELRIVCINSLRPSGAYMLHTKLTNTGSDNGLSPGQHQATIWINAGILLIVPLRTNFSGILIKIDTFSLKKIYFKISSVKLRPFCLGLNVLSHWFVESVQKTCNSNVFSGLVHCNLLLGLTHWPMEDVAVILKVWFSNWLCRIGPLVLAVELLYGKCD